MGLGGGVFGGSRGGSVYTPRPPKKVFSFVKLKGIENHQLNHDLASSTGRGCGGWHERCKENETLTHQKYV